MMKYFLLAALSVVSACTTSGSMKPTNSSATQFQVSGYKYNDLWSASKEVLNNTSGSGGAEMTRSLSVKEENKEKGRLVASTSVGLFSWGELIGVYIIPPKDAPKHTVKVESQSKGTYNVTATNWEPIVEKALKQKIQEIKK